MKPPSLYASLGLDAAASHAEVKKAYHRLALQLHPDKNPGDAEAAGRFQALQKVYGVLGDADKRAALTEDLPSADAADLYTYYRTVYRKLSEEDIAAYEAEYRGSAAEAKELKALYCLHSGDMRAVFERLVCSREDADSRRFAVSLRAAIDAGEVPSHAAFLKWEKRALKRAPPAADPPASAAAGASGLTAAISLRQRERNEAILASLTARYTGGPSPKRKAGREGGEPTDEEFEAARARVEARRGGAGAGGKRAPRKKQ